MGLNTPLVKKAISAHYHPAQLSPISSPEGNKRKTLTTSTAFHMFDMRVNLSCSIINHPLFHCDTSTMPFAIPLLVVAVSTASDVSGNYGEILHDMIGRYTEQKAPIQP